MIAYCPNNNIVLDTVYDNSEFVVQRPWGWKFFGPGMFWGPKFQCIFGKYTIWPFSPEAEYIQLSGHKVFKLSIKTLFDNRQNTDPMPTVSAILRPVPPRGQPKDQIYAY